MNIRIAEEKDFDDVKKITRETIMEIYPKYYPHGAVRFFAEHHSDEMLVPSYANSTYDNPYFDKETAYKYYNEFMWGRRYAKIITVEQAIELLQG